MNYKGLVFSLIFLLHPLAAAAHPMPATQLLLDMHEHSIAGDLQLPLNELQLALGTSRDVISSPGTLVARDSAWLADYVISHLHPVSQEGKLWMIKVLEMNVAKAEQNDTGPFSMLDIRLSMEPSPGENSRAMLLYYDAIMHQVVTHRALVSIRQDWAGGQVDSVIEVGVISMNPADNIVPPLPIHLDKGSNWRGFMSMLWLGIAHIAEGTDHLLFLLVLLLPAPLLVRAGKWSGLGGTRYSLIRLLKIATAFTIGHSITLLAGALGWLRLPAQPVEVLIAVSILVTAVHAVRPIFPGREGAVATGFGLVHGLAFARVLAGLQLSGGRMALSILGFNLGIEVMQLFVIVMVVPWLIVASGNWKWYDVLRIGGAAVAGLAAMAWITERISGKGNSIGEAVLGAASGGKWIVLGLAVFAVASHFARRDAWNLKT